MLSDPITPKECPGCGRPLKVQTVTIRAGDMQQDVPAGNYVCLNGCELLPGMGDTVTLAPKP